MEKKQFFRELLSLVNKRKGSIFNIGYYFLASFIPMLIQLFLSPVYSIYLSAEDLAITGYFASFTGLLAPLILFYMNQYYMRDYYFRKKEERRNLRAMVFKSLLLYPFIIMGVCLLGIFLYMRIFISETKIDAINKENINIITATKEDTTDLSRKMLYALEHPQVMEIIADRAKIYAQNHFSVSSIGEKLISDVKSIVGHYYGNLAIPEDSQI